jgi:hypothetical protein
MSLRLDIRSMYAPAIAGRLSFGHVERALAATNDPLS